MPGLWGPSDVLGTLGGGRTPEPQGPLKSSPQSSENGAQDSTPSTSQGCRHTWRRGPRSPDSGQRSEARLLLSTCRTQPLGGWGAPGIGPLLPLWPGAEAAALTAPFRAGKEVWALRTGPQGQAWVKVSRRLLILLCKEWLAGAPTPPTSDTHLQAGLAAQQDCQVSQLSLQLCLWIPQLHPQVGRPPTPRWPLAGLCVHPCHLHRAGEEEAPC